MSTARAPSRLSSERVWQLTANLGFQGTGRQTPASYPVTQPEEKEEKMVRIHHLVAGVLVTLLFAACGSTTSVASGDDGVAKTETTTSEQEVTESSDELADPPPVVLLNTQNPLTLTAWTYCWSFNNEGICSRQTCVDHD